ncbi:stage III sporulation protein AD [Alicyclobacillus tengchongensis]|uniref:Stage III sporulation protein AD n=3 Tax=Alicyclobacillus tolerans TaxID=90970 RepID=A0ABT9LWU3_9BACL|nr:stage III sporulation protein AD [Alicyclobacillus montanus]MDP9728748.1 stage III sporulation protein AD [Alicyclobacillus tengchongensis]SHK39259.1 stage III sporulation protein AD [Alicyclobacillus montanus]
MHIMQLVGFGLSATILATVLRSYAPQFAMLVALLAGILLFTSVIQNISVVLDMLRGLSSSAHIDSGFFSTVLKIIGIAYIVEFAGQVARDAGEGALASKIELAGKISIVILAIPIVNDVVQSLMHLLPQ